MKLKSFWPNWCNRFRFVADIGIKRAIESKKTGIGLGIKNSGHYGLSGYYRTR